MPYNIDPKLEKLKKEIRQRQRAQRATSVKKEKEKVEKKQEEVENLKKDYLQAGADKLLFELKSKFVFHFIRHIETEYIGVQKPNCAFGLT